MKNFNNKKVFITGGSKGIGLAAAKAFAGLGADVVIIARSEKPLKKALRIIKSSAISETQRFFYHTADATEYSSLKNVMDKAVSDSGGCDIIICCPGGANPDYFENISESSFDNTIKLNLYTTRNTVSAILPHMKKTGGNIVSVSSIAGFLGVFGYTDYCASKFALIGFSEALRAEVKKYKINISVLCPPDTDTPGFENENMTKPEETRAISDNAKLMHPDKVAAALIKGIEKNRFMIIPGFEGKTAWLLKRFFPSLIDSIMSGAVKKVQKKKN